MLVAVRRSLPRKVRNCRIGIDQALKVDEFAKTYRITYPVLIAGAHAIELMRRLGNALGGLPILSW